MFNYFMIGSSRVTLFVISQYIVWKIPENKSMNRAKYLQKVHALKPAQTYTHKICVTNAVLANVRITKKTFLNEINMNVIFILT